MMKTASHHGRPIDFGTHGNNMERNTSKNKNKYDEEEKMSLGDKS